MKLLVAIFFGFTCATSRALASAPASVLEAAEEEQTCTWEDREACGCKGTNHKALTFGFGGGLEETFCAYHSPDIATYYNATPGSIKAKRPKFNGFFGKFINLSKDTVQVYWSPKGKNKQKSYIADVAPFGCAGTVSIFISFVAPLVPWHLLTHFSLIRQRIQVHILHQQIIQCILYPLASNT
jgi:hypothetical protein